MNKSKNFGIKIGKSVSGNKRELLYKLEGFTKGSKKYVLKTHDYNGNIKVINQDIEYSHENFEKTRLEMEKYIIEAKEDMESTIKSYQDQMARYVKQIEDNTKKLSYYKTPSLITEKGIFSNEIEFGTKAGELGLGPKILTWTNDRNSYVMEHIEGTKMNDIDIVIKMNLPILKDIFAQLNKVIKVMHQNGIYHNYLKGNNIIVSNIEDVKNLKFLMVNFDNATSYPINGFTGNKTTDKDPDEADAYYTQGIFEDIKAGLNYTRKMDVLV